MRLASVILLAACLAAPVAADDPNAGKVPPPPSERPAYNGQELGIYRFGATYSTFQTSSASDCQSRCSSDTSCLAWSHVSAMGDAGARCELKRGGGKVVENMSAVSGISARHEARFSPPPPVLRTTHTTLSGGPTDAGTVITSTPTIITMSSTPGAASTTTMTTTTTVRYPAPTVSSATGDRVTVPLNTAPVNTNTSVTYEQPKSYYPNAEKADGGKSTAYYPERSRIVVGEPQD